MWLLVFGLFAHDRGFFRDETWIFNALEDSRGFAARWLWPGGFSRTDLPQRVLTGVPFALAALTGAPEVALQWLYGLAWLLSAAAAAWLACVLDARRRAFTAFAAAALALTACGDASVNYAASLVAQFSAGAYVAALAALFHFWRGDGRRWLLIMGLPLWLSLWSYDTALPAALATPLVLWALEGLRPTPRLARAACAWYAWTLPYLIAFAWFARLPGSYARRALWPLPVDEVVGIFARLVSANVMPWTWPRVFAQDEPNLFAWGLHAPAGLLAGGVTLGTLAFALTALRLWRRDADAARAPLPGSIGALLLLAVVSNAGYVWVGDARALFRTQLVSRLLVSVALVLLVPLLARRLRVFALALLVPFVAFGIAAGLAGQLAYLGVWRAQKAAMASMLQALPRSPPGSALVVYVPPQVTHHPLTTAGASNMWLRLLYGRAGAAFVWSEQVEGQRCRVERQGLRCGTSGTSLPWRTTVILSWAPERDAFVLSHGPEPLAPALARALGAGEPRDRARRLVARDEWLGRLLPGRTAPALGGPRVPPQPLCSTELVRGFRPLPVRRGRLDRWLERRAQVEVGSGGPARLRLRVELAAVFPPDVVSVSLNGQPVARLELPEPGARVLELTDAPLLPGANLLTFASARPVDPAEAGGRDLPFLRAEGLEVACVPAGSDAAAAGVGGAPEDEDPPRPLAGFGPCEPTASRPRRVARAPAGDFDGDGHADLLLRGRDGRAQVWFMERGACAARAELVPPPGADLRVAATGDFDGDGRGDVVVQHARGDVWLWRLGGPTGTERVGPEIPLTPAPGPELRVVGAGDVDGDGRPELVFERRPELSAVIWRLQGFSRARALEPRPAAAGLGWTLAGVLDVDGDGRLDLLWQNPLTRRLVVWWLDARLVRRGGRYTEPDAPAPGARLEALGGRGPAGGASLAFALDAPPAIEVWRLDRAGRRRRQTRLALDAWRGFALAGPR